MPADHGTPVMPVDDPAAVARAAAELVGGGTVVIPTDTVYGLAVLPGTPGGAAAVFALKDRPAGVPLAVLVASREQAVDIAEPLPVVAAELVERWWPGPLTVVVRRRAGYEADLGGDGVTVGLRCPDHDFVLALTAEVGPIAATSANRHGQQTAATARRAAASLTAPVDLVVDGGPCDGAPSTVVDCTGPDLRVLREGVIPYSALRTPRGG